MKKVVLLGDSIRLRGYGTKVPELLGSEWEVWQPEDNGRFSLYTLQVVKQYLSHIDEADVVHWNNGNWDVDDLYGEGALSDPEQYVKTLLRIARILKAHCKRVIFATTTPVRSTYRTANNERIQEYNGYAIKALTEIGVEIDDLYHVVEPKLEEYIREDDAVHLTEAGIDACAKVVVKAICE